MNWNAVAYGNGTFCAPSYNNSASAYYSFPALPVAYGIYNGATVRA